MSFIAPPSSGSLRHRLPFFGFVYSQAFRLVPSFSRSAKKKLGRSRALEPEYEHGI